MIGTYKHDGCGSQCYGTAGAEAMPRLGVVARLPQGPPRRALLEAVRQQRRQRQGVHLSQEERRDEACTCGLLSVTSGLPLGLVVYCLGLLGFPAQWPRPNRSSCRFEDFNSKLFASYLQAPKRL